MKPVTAVAISGGIDSLVAAYLLQEKGHRVIGVHFITGFENRPLFSKPSGRSPDDSADRRILNHPIHHIADQLGIPVEILDCRDAFKKKIVDYFIQTYMAGLPPNRCRVCTAFIKFGTVL